MKNYAVFMLVVLYACPVFSSDETDKCLDWISSAVETMPWALAHGPIGRGR